MNPDDLLMRYWLEHEYAEPIKPYLTCSHLQDLCRSDQQDWLISHPHSSPLDGFRGLWSHRPRLAPGSYVRYLISSKRFLGFQSADPKAVLANGEGLSLVAYQITRLRQHSDAQELQALLQLCMGAQYSSVVISDYFPCSDDPGVKLAQFYSYVVLGDQDRARYLYQQIEPLIDSICLRLNTTAGLIFSNIRSLYLLRSGLSAADVLPINQLLVKHGTQIGHRTLTAILLLNQARLNRILGYQKDSINLLEESFATLSDIASFKLRLYYVLQLALICGRRDELLDVLFRVVLENPDVHQCFGWRIARLMTNRLDADMVTGLWSSTLSEALLQRGSVALLLHHLLRIDA